MAKRIYFFNLDVFRFFAALLIFFGHGFLAWTGFFSGKRLEEFPEVVQNFMVNSGLGVELFFLISGFLITYILLYEKERTGRIAIGKFFTRRAIRIWPLYFMLIAITPFLVEWLGKEQPPYMGNLFFIGNYEVIANLEQVYPFSHFWSIAVEEQFYVVWPFIIAFVPKKWLTVTFIFIISFSILSRLYFFGTEKAYHHFYFNTLCRMDTIALGAVVALHYDKIKNVLKLNRLALIITTLVLIGVLLFTKSNEWKTTMEVMFRKYLYLIPMLFFTFHFISSGKERKQNLVVRGINYMGRASYGLYMIHNFLIVLILRRIMFNNGIYEGWVFWLIYIGLTLVTVILSFELYEKPIMKLKRYFTVVKTRKF